MRVCYAPTFFYGHVKLRTIEAYLESVELYINVIGDLPIDKLTPENNICFVQALNKRNFANETIRKHCGHLNTIFFRMGPPGPRNRDAFGFLKEPPWIRPPRPFLKLPRDVLDVQVENLYRACAQTSACYQYPVYLDPYLRPKWWETLILFIVSTALRHGAVFGLTWENLDFGCHRIIVPATLDKCRRERIKPLHPFVLQGFRAIQCGDTVAGSLMPWIHSQRVLYQIWHAINDSAGIMPRLTLHDLKRYALQRAIRSGVDAVTLQMLGDHSSLKTATDYYVRGNLEQYVEKLILPGMEVVQ